MARFKDYNLDQDKLIPICFSKQVTPGTFEYTISYLVDNILDLSVFETRYNNNDTGAPAYDPALLLKIVFVAYSRGVTSSRKIERLCRENIVFMALSADSQPHFTTIANFISRMDEVIQPLFVEVLMTCDQAGLIGGKMFAIDGCKLPSNASRELSGTKKELEKKHRKIDRAVRRMLVKHREEDDSIQENDHERRLKEAQQIETLRQASRKIKQFTRTMDDKRGISGGVIKSNITDNDSATMKTSHGTVQGYNGVAAVDEAHQIVVAGEAFGQGPENNLLAPIVEAVTKNMGEDYVKRAHITADSGFHSKNTLTYCYEQQLDVYLADGNFRKRDPRFKERDRFQPKERRRGYYPAEDFTVDTDTQQCRCPAGKTLLFRGERERYGNHYLNFVGRLNDCRSCPLQSQCLRQPPETRGRQVSIKLGQANLSQEPQLIAQMKEKIDSDRGRYIYSQRLGTVEPVFGNINTTKRLNRFSLRGKTKVNAQWLMYCVVHNIEKLQRYGSIGQLST